MTLKKKSLPTAADGYYSTDNYTRIRCNVCGNKEVDVLKPGQSFDGIKKCSCQTIKPKPKPRTKPLATKSKEPETLELKSK